MTPPRPELSFAHDLLRAGEDLFDQALGRAKTITADGRNIDEHQVTTERIAYAATEVRAAREVLASSDRVREEGRSSEPLDLLAVTTECCDDFVVTCR